ncbi:molybdate ABC transporter substrate-binding protein [Oscillospiraceae bacterium PP1C4]
MRTKGLTEMMKKILCGVLATLMVAALGGCGAKNQTPAASSEAPAASSQAASAGSKTEAPAVELMVSAAASLTDCMNELKGIYEGENKAVKITCNFGSSGSLQQQIEQGAPADVFFSAGKKQMTALSEKKLMNDASIKEILENKVVLITPKGAEKIASFEDLAGEKVTKIGVGEPESVPVGQYTAEIFEKLKLTEALKPKLVFAKDVREVLSWVETGNVQAGIVYETDAKISDKVEICATAPEGSHKKVIYPIGVTKESKHAAEAQAFVDFLFTDKAKEVFVKYGFTTIA